MSNLWLKIKKYFSEIIIPKLTNIQWLEIPISTYVRWILAIILSLNTLLTYCNINPIPFSENSIYEVVSVILNILVLIINTYKNNSTSKEALITDQIMRALKAAKKSDEDRAIGKLKDILIELNGEDYISESTEKETENKSDN